MNYLTRVFVDRKEAAVKKFSDSYAWHCALWSVFDKEADASRDFLFRIDPRHDSFRILLLSKDPPNIPDWGTWESKAIASRFLEHNSYVFNLRANPTVKRVVRDAKGNRKPNGRRTAIYDPEELAGWISRKSKQSGFRLSRDSLKISPPIPTYFQKKKRRGKLVQVDFSGILAIEDRSRFVNAFDQGIGSAKAFGFGMLMLQPIRLPK